ncbi:MAG: lipoate--protein ligase, partial [Oscillospiraceae bacterium]|nr:lipoate--protein ligase [Oscillospiraceae bacterium]
MIRKLYIYETDCTDPYRNIATEKYLLEQGDEDSCILYLWQNAHTVVIGRNQNAWSECRTSLLTEEAGKLARRLSGGGAVYHDMGNLNFTFLVSDADYDVDRQLSVIQAACEKLGIPTERSGRNDLLADGKKFSGNAFYHSKGRAYHHGTLLMEADMEKLSRYLTPPKAKLEAKGVASVRSRVTNLKALCPEITCQRLKQCLQEAFGEIYGLTPEFYTLDAAAEEKIAQDAQMLQSWEWLYGPKLPLSFSCEDYFPWGYLQLQLQ